MSATMRDRFYATAEELVGADERMAVVLADIGSGRMPAAEDAHADRVINVGIREQLMVGVAAGLAMTGFRPIVHSYAPFAVERPFEMLKLDLGHNDVGAIVVSVGASYDAAANGRTHQTPTLTTIAPTSLCPDRKSTRLNSSHSQISYAVFCLKKKKRDVPSRPRARVSCSRSPVTERTRLAQLTHVVITLEKT